MTNKTNSVLYIGVTNDIVRRVREHKMKQIDGFTKRYNITKLVYFEEFSDPHTAISREKQLKHWIRAKKVALIETKNPDWNDWGESLR